MVRSRSISMRYGSDDRAPRIRAAWVDDVAAVEDLGPLEDLIDIAVLEARKAASARA